jgi:hypothetical protein
MIRQPHEVNNALIVEAAKRLERQGSLFDRNIHEAPTIPKDEVLNKASSELADDLLVELHATEFESFKNNLHNIIDGFTDQIDDADLRNFIRAKKPGHKEMYDMFKKVVTG